MESKTSNPAQRRYRFRFILIMLLYVLSLVITSVSFHDFHQVGLLVYVLAVLPALPILAIMVAYGLYLADEKDEFLRRFRLESMLWGIGPTLAVTTVWGSLAKFAHIQRMDPFLVYPLYCVFVIVATNVLKRRYR